MTEAGAAAGTEQDEGFRGRVVLALVCVGLLAFLGFVVLGAYAPELRERTNGGAHALSSSAVGFRGAVVMLHALDRPAAINRGRFNAAQLRAAVLVQTPPPNASAKALDDHPEARRTLIVLPKWSAVRDPLTPGRVRKAGVLRDTGWVGAMLKGHSPSTAVAVDAGLSRPVLRGQPRTFAAGWDLQLGSIDQLQTASGPGWEPVLVDAAGRGVLLHAKSEPYVYLLADPDLLNNQGIADIDTARVGIATLIALAGDGVVLFDVNLNGLGQQRSLLRLMLEPPWLAATICLLGAALLIGLHGLARFGAPQRQGRAIALGASALVDNSAGLIRLARKEPALAPDYLQMLIGEIALEAGPAATLDPDWLDRHAQRRGLPAPAELHDQANKVRKREDLTTFAAAAYKWRQEMTRDRR